MIAPSTYFEDAEKEQPSLSYVKPTVYLLVCGYWLRDDYQQGLSLSWSKNLKAKTSAPKSGKDDDDERSFYFNKTPAGDFNEARDRSWKE